MAKATKACRKCNNQFPSNRNTHSRSYCLDCSPPGSGNGYDLRHEETEIRRKESPSKRVKKKAKSKDKYPRWMKYSNEILREAVSVCISVSGVLRKLNIRPGGGNHAHITRRIRELGLDTSHFRRSIEFLRPDNNKLKAEDVLVLDRFNGRKESSQRLRRSMIESGVVYKCVSCPIINTYNGFPILLEINHKDENCLNNVLSNLEFRCPNCHQQFHQSIIKPLQEKPCCLTIKSPRAQSLTKKSIVVNKCIDCKKDISRRRNRCKSCAAKIRNKPKINWPTVDELLARLSYTSYVQLGKQLGVSDNAIRKHLIIYRNDINIVIQ